MSYVIDLFDINQLRYIFRIILACICGVVIGFERKNRAKEAGIRTHCLVACASALMIVISKYGFFDVLKMSMSLSSEIKLDPSRVASGIVSGVGFLGAGMIFVQKHGIKGLTTAAGIWATSGIGMAIGAGMYAVGIATTAIIIFAQIYFHSSAKWLATARTTVLTIYQVDDENFREKADKVLLEHGIVIQDVSIIYHADTKTKDYVITIELFENAPIDEIVTSFNYSASIGNNDM